MFNQRDRDRMFHRDKVNWTARGLTKLLTPRQPNMNKRCGQFFFHGTVPLWTLRGTNLLCRSVLHRFPFNLSKICHSPPREPLHQLQKHGHATIYHSWEISRVCNEHGRSDDDKPDRPRTRRVNWDVKACSRHALACIQSAIYYRRKHTLSGSLWGRLKGLTYDWFRKSCKMRPLAPDLEEGSKKVREHQKGGKIRGRKLMEWMKEKNNTGQQRWAGCCTFRGKDERKGKMKHHHFQRYTHKSNLTVPVSLPPISYLCNTHANRRQSRNTTDKHAAKHQRNAQHPLNFNTKLLISSKTSDRLWKHEAPLVSLSHCWATTCSAEPPADKKKKKKKKKKSTQHCGTPLTDSQNTELR